MRRLWFVVLLASGCNKQDRAEPPPAPAEKVATPAAAAPVIPVDEPLDPVRVDAEKGNRAALALMTRAIPCPQQAPSTFVRYCRAAEDFASGNVSELAEGDTVLVGEMSIIETGPPSVRTLGTPMPVAFLLRRNGRSVSAKEVVLQSKDNDAMATLVARIGKTIDGHWDHVDVPSTFADQVASLSTATMDPLDQSDGALWPHELNGMELRRAGGRWILVAAPDGEAGRHVIGIFADKHKVLGPKEKSPQKVTVLHL